MFRKAGAAGFLGITGIAMTEPGTGSDLAAVRTTAVREGDDYVLNGSKTFITNGINADLVIVVGASDPTAGHPGISLLVVESGMAGFERGRNLDKIGVHANDTAELFFSDVRVPVANRLGDEGSGFRQLMGKLPQRLGIAIVAVAQAEAALGWTLEYAKERHAFGQSIGSFEHNRFTLAELRTELDIAQVYIDRQVELHNAGQLTAEDAAKAKMVDDRAAMARPQLLPPTPRRLRLHGGIPHRPGLARRPRPRHLRRHQRDHEGDHRPVPRPPTLAHRSQSRGLTPVYPVRTIARTEVGR